MARIAPTTHIGLGLIVFIVAAQLVADYTLLPEALGLQSIRISPLLLLQLPLPALAATAFLTRRGAMGWFILALYLVGASLGWWCVLQAEEDSPLLEPFAFAAYPANIAALGLLLTYLIFEALRNVVRRFDP